MKDVERLSAFAEQGRGGNPAGVWIGDALPEASEMQRIAAEVGYSETAFAAMSGDHWRVRYFAPAMEVPFCGHATIALGAALGRRFGPAIYPLELNNASISVEAIAMEDGAGGSSSWGAALVSPPTKSGPAKSDEEAELLAAFGLSDADLEPGAPPARAHGGADHLVWRLQSRETLERFGAEMDYPFEKARALMEAAGLVTIMLVWRESSDLFRVRNAFAAGGVVEDPATGAAAAAFAGLLRDEGRLPANGAFTILQGVEMGAPSRILVEAPAEPGAGVRVSGGCRWITRA